MSVVRPQLTPVWAFILVTSLFFLWGFAYGLLDVLNKHFQNVLGITKLQSTGLQVAYFGIGYFAFSPVAGEVLKRRGYKTTILMGLALYSLGAILFWPVAKSATTSKNSQAVFAGFVICTGVTACGLASLEVSANSYVSVMPPLEIASLRLQLSQSFNGVASFTGPLIASKYFFSEEHSNDLSTVQWVYLAVALMGVAVALAFVVTKLPEVSEELLNQTATATVGLPVLAEELQPKSKPLWKESRAISGAIAQFLYVGAQVTIGAFFLFYTHEVAGIADTRGSQLLSYGLILFTVGRFVAVALLAVITPAVLLFACAIIATVLVVLITTLHGMSGVACVMTIMFFESCMYPIIFTLSTANLGLNTRRAAALVVMGVSGGAVFPPMQGAIADKWDTKVSFWIVFPCFIYIALWAVYIWNLDGRQVMVIGKKAPVVHDAETAYPNASATSIDKFGDVKQVETAESFDKKHGVNGSAVGGARTAVAY